MCKTVMTLHQWFADSKCTNMQRDRKCQGTHCRDRTENKGLQQRASLGESQWTTAWDTAHDRTWNVWPLLLPPLKVPMIWTQMKKKIQLGETNAPLGPPPHLMAVSQGATARSFSVIHASLPYHSQHLLAWQMSVCHSLTRVCSACVCWVCEWARVSE